MHIPPPDGSVLQYLQYMDYTHAFGMTSVGGGRSAFVLAWMDSSPLQISCGWSARATQPPPLVSRALATTLVLDAYSRSCNTSFSRCVSYVQEIDGSNACTMCARSILKIHHTNFHETSTSSYASYTQSTAHCCTNA